MSPTEYQRFMERIAARYRREGYDVTIEPSARMMKDWEPFFAGLAGFRPDIVATRNEQRVVVEIKKPDRAKDAARSEMLRALADFIKGRKDWRLDLVLYDPEIHKDDRLAGSSTVRKKLGEARLLFAEDQKVASLLLAWSALEASAKRAIQRVTGESVAKGTPHDVIKNLVFHGLLPEAEFDEFRRIADRRNRAAHGGLSERVSRTDIERVCELAEHLLDAKALEAT